MKQPLEYLGVSLFHYVCQNWRTLLVGVVSLVSMMVLVYLALGTALASH